MLFRSCDLSVFSKSGKDNGKISGDDSSEEIVNANGQRELRESDIIHFGGSVRSLKTHNTRKGDVMAFVEIENFSGIAEVTIFSDIYADSREMIKKDNLVFLQAKVQKRNGGNTLIAEKVVPIDMVREVFSGRIFIDIDSSVINEEALSSFSKVFESEKRGNCQVFFKVKTKDDMTVIIKVHDKLKLRVTDDVIEKAHHLFGRDSVSTFLQ